MTEQSLTTQGTNERQILNAIDAKPLADTTKAQYKREVVKALEAGVHLADATSVADYAADLNTSSRSFLRAGLRVWTQRVRLEAQSQATPDNMADVGAVIHRLDALDHAVELEASKGQKAHFWLTTQEVKRFMNEARTAGRLAKRDAVVLGLLVGAGLRRDELVNLTWKQVTRQGERFVLDIQGKGKKKRVIPLSDRLASILEDWRQFCEGLPGDRVIRGLKRAGTLTDSLTSAQVFNIVRKYGKRIGQPDLAPHDLRRTYAQIGYDNGVAITQLSLLLGHSSVAVTERYLNVKLDLSVTASDFVPL